MNKTKQTLLENQIKHHNYTYYVLGHSAISDKDFDKLYEELQNEYPNSEVLQTVGNDMTSGFPKAKHLMTMGSQSKLKTIEQIAEWTDKKGIQFPVTVEWKYDGISIELQYEKGALRGAITRGDSVIGDEITDNAIKMKGLPSFIDSSFTGSIRGEIVMSFSLFNNKYADKFANPRNLASGMAKSKSGDNCEDLTIICYDALSLDNSAMHFKTEESKESFLKKNNFITFPKRFARNVKDIYVIANEYKDLREEFDYPVDGVVLKQFIVLPSDMNKLRPDAQRAYKWEDEGSETILRDIEWSRSGTTYTPIAVFDSVQIEGSTVSRASLANESLIHELDLAIGDTILVTKRNMIIPKIEEVVKRPESRTEIQYPTHCSCCGELLVRENKKLYCSNAQCSGRSEHQIAKWLGIMNAKGFGTSLQEHLFNTGIHDIIDLYDDEKVAYSKSQTNLKENFTKAFKGLYSVKEIPLADFMSGFDINGLGRRMFESVILSGYDTVDKILSLVRSEKQINITNMGEERIIQLLKGLSENEEKMLNLILKLSTKNIKIIEKEEIKLESKCLQGLQICVTGKLNSMSRKEINNFITVHGGIASSGVNKHTSILVTNDTSSGSSKVKAAEKFGTKIISEDELYARCN